MSESHPDRGAAHRTPPLQAGRHDKYRPASSTRTGVKAFFLALLVHALLAAMLFSGLRWQAHAPEGVSAELWVPADAADTPDQPPPKAETKVAAATPPARTPQLPPQTVDALARSEQAPAEAMDPDIAIEQERRARAERLRVEAEEKRRAAEEAERIEAERQARQEELERQERERAEAEEKARIEAEEQARQKREARAVEERLREQKAKEEQARKEAEEQARREAEEKAQREAQEEEKRAAEEKARQEQEAAEKARREAEEKAKREAEEKARQEREAAAKAKREAEVKAKREAEAKAKRAAEQKAQKEREAKERAARQRAQYLEGLREQAGSGSGAGAGGSAGSGADAAYAAQLSGIIRTNTTFLIPPGLSGNPKAVFHVRLTPEGRIRSIELIRSSGLPAWDAAAQRGIERSDPLPKRADGTVPDSIEITSGPLDEH